MKLGLFSFPGVSSQHLWVQTASGGEITRLKDLELDSGEEDHVDVPGCLGTKEDRTAGFSKRTWNMMVSTICHQLLTYQMLYVIHNMNTKNNIPITSLSHDYIYSIHLYSAIRMIRSHMTCGIHIVFWPTGRCLGLGLGEVDCARTYLAGMLRRFAKDDLQDKGDGVEAAIRMHIQTVPWERCNHLWYKLMGARIYPI